MNSIKISNDWLDKATEDELESIFICWAACGYDLYHTTMNEIKLQYVSSDKPLSEILTDWYNDNYPEVNGNSSEAFMAKGNKVYKVIWS